VVRHRPAKPRIVGFDSHSVLQKDPRGAGRASESVLPRLVGRPRGANHRCQPPRWILSQIHTHAFGKSRLLSAGLLLQICATFLVPPPPSSESRYVFRVKPAPACRCGGGNSRALGCNKCIRANSPDAQFPSTDRHRSPSNSPSSRAQDVNVPGRVGPPRNAAVQQLLTSPLAFEPNQGQADPSARFLARSPAYSMFFTPEHVEFLFSVGHDRAKANGNRNAPPASPLMEFVDSRKDTKMAGQSQSPAA
jgi:hypothetical protein